MGIGQKIRYIRQLLLGMLHVTICIQKVANKVLAFFCKQNIPSGVYSNAQEMEIQMNLKNLKP